MPRCQNAGEDEEACRGCAADALRDFRGESRPPKQHNCTPLFRDVLYCVKFIVDGLIGAMLYYGLA